MTSLQRDSHISREYFQLISLFSVTPSLCVSDVSNSHSAEQSQTKAHADGQVGGTGGLEALNSVQTSKHPVEGTGPRRRALAPACFPKYPRASVGPATFGSLRTRQADWCPTVTQESGGEKVKSGAARSRWLSRVCGEKTFAFF